MGANKDEIQNQSDSPVKPSNDMGGKDPATLIKDIDSTYQKSHTTIRRYLPIIIVAILIAVLSVVMVNVMSRGKGTTPSSWYKADPTKVLYSPSSSPTTGSNNIVVDLDPNLIPIVYGT
ncbi:MAG: hypothetical protein LBK50_00195, partial [Candidatus Nomurabacteria bacterium]|nr:hypothetical protein [Candidatus Nomurabacteria bacterium]